jgi:hypothetical protein
MATRKPSDPLAAYAFHPNDDLLVHLFALNLDLARREESTQPVTAPETQPRYPSRIASLPSIASGSRDAAPPLPLILRRPRQ